MDWRRHPPARPTGKHIHSSVPLRTKNQKPPTKQHYLSQSGFATAHVAINHDDTPHKLPIFFRVALACMQKRARINRRAVGKKKQKLAPEDLSRCISSTNVFSARLFSKHIW